MLISLYVKFLVANHNSSHYSESHTYIRHGHWTHELTAGNYRNQQKRNGALKIRKTKSERRGQKYCEREIKIKFKKEKVEK